MCLVGVAFGVHQRHGQRSTAAQTFPYKPSKQVSDLSIGVDQMQNGCIKSSEGSYDSNGKAARRGVCVITW